jgi:hypothetical protein
MTKNLRIDRRQFAKGLVTASSVVVAGSAVSLNAAPDEKPATETKDPAKPGADASDPVELPEELLLLNCLMQRYPSEHFDEAAIRGIFRDIRGDLARGRILSEFPLKNSDEPCYVFRVYRSPE